MPNSAAELELVKTELEDPKYQGLRIDRVVDEMNDPKPVGTETSYRTLTADEVWNEVSTPNSVRLQTAETAYIEATATPEKNAALAGAALFGQIAYIGSINVAPASQGRKLLDDALSIGYLTAAEHAAIIGKGTTTTEVRQNCWQRWGWSHSVTIALVEEAMS